MALLFFISALLYSLLWLGRRVVDWFFFPFSVLNKLWGRIYWSTHIHNTVSLRTVVLLHLSVDLHGIMWLGTKVFSRVPFKVQVFHSVPILSVLFTVLFVIQWIEIRLVPDPLCLIGIFWQSQKSLESESKIDVEHCVENWVHATVQVADVEENFEHPYVDAAFATHCENKICLKSKEPLKIRKN